MATVGVGVRFGGGLTSSKVTLGDGAGVSMRVNCGDYQNPAE